MNTNRQWTLAKRPFGMVGPDNFEFRETPIPTPGDGEVLVRNLYLSFDPTQRGWIQSGELIYQNDIQEGFENIPQTPTRLFTGQNRGKQLLKIANPS